MGEYASTLVSLGFLLSFQRQQEHLCSEELLVYVGWEYLGLELLHRERGLFGEARKKSAYYLKTVDENNPLLDLDILIAFLLCVLEPRAVFSCLETMVPHGLVNHHHWFSVHIRSQFNNWVGGRWVM